MIRMIVALTVCLPAALCYKFYQNQIPNGDHVAHPCKPNYLWHGVGHRNRDGGGDRNPFGEDFGANGHVWNSTLCNKDSDGDGRTNGEELGDPECVWTQGQVPSRTKNITHPGVCDPWNEVMCVSKNTWLDCSQDLEFNCPALEDPDVLNITVRLPRTKVPAKETTYICYNFEIPDDREYHLIATQPYIDNANVMHHIIMNSCNNNVRLASEPYECLMGTGCTTQLGGWTLGQTGRCIRPEAGILIGKGHSSMIVIQLHWTNPGLVDEWFDSSGLILYYTPKLRRYNAGTLVLGQTYLSIPPGVPSWSHKGSCTSRCTRKIFRGDIQIISVGNHMHYSGNRQNVTLTRPGKPLEVLADDNPYRYDTPVVHIFDPPVTVEAGDQLDTQCTYQTRSRPFTTTYGEGSFDEMCYSFLWYYPIENLTTPTSFCIQWKDTDFCDLFQECRINKFLNASDPSTSAVISKVLQNCDPVECRAECPAAIAEVTAENGCLRNPWDYVYKRIMTQTPDVKLMKFASAMESCKTTGDVTDKPIDVTPRPTEPHEPKPESPGGMFLSLVKSLGSRPLLQNIIMNTNYNNYGVGYNNHDGIKNTQN